MSRSYREGRRKIFSRRQQGNGGAVHAIPINPRQKKPRIPPKWMPNDDPVVHIPRKTVRSMKILKMMGYHVI